MAPGKHRWGRSQKYHERPRHLYALLFGNGCCYIGQTVNLNARLSQHKSPAGGWAGNVFTMVPLGVVHCTQQCGEDYEYAWRYKAACAGWRVYGKPGVFINPARRLTLERRMLAWSLTWPKAHHRAMGCMPVLVVIGFLLIIVAAMASGM